ncbi:ABC-three component system middle component 1 [Acinetobacter pittii]|uniref:ABC-three component system middle component 1 n=1 Tax=Acinetobacter pittii TaxID=48296 RepID=UPI0024DE2928|nr:ABC-three component system middle component 1 [Acinetobacter pittii]
MKAEKWVKEITDLIPSHYGVIYESKTVQFKQLAPQEIGGEVILLRRVKSQALGYKTILVASAENIEDLSEILYWAANVRDNLPEPCTSDLYLFLSIKNISIDECNRIEADDQYCRKIIKRPEETTEDFINRTFLVLPLSQNKIMTVNDPITNALHHTAKEYPNFAVAEQEYWYQELLSNKRGEELAEQILGYLQIKGE